jgi:hypothetical protein
LVVAEAVAAVCAVLQWHLFWCSAPLEKEKEKESFAWFLRHHSFLQSIFLSVKP